MSMTATTDTTAMDTVLDHAHRIGTNVLRGHVNDMNGAVILTLRINQDTHARGTGHTAEGAAEDLLDHITHHPVTHTAPIELAPLDPALQPELDKRRTRLRALTATQVYAYARGNRCGLGARGDFELACLHREAQLVASIRELGGTA